MFRSMFSAAIGSAVTPDGNPVNLHFVMFLPTLMGQGTPAQISEVTNLVMFAYFNIIYEKIIRQNG